ncbi:hypothetical protein RNJ44_04260 [Nakaseomyces bracarensis]|uniref:DNA helicase n=1 Tax=Nakaseomyces bracarensis TaxID=273131 RepID=A0ABR4NUD9_9SACH
MEGYDKIDEDLGDLGVNVLSQSSLEKKIESDVTNYTVQQQAEQEEKRLERTRNALEKCLKKKKLLERRLKVTTRISVKAKLRDDIRKLEEGEERKLRDDIDDIKQRLNAVLSNKDGKGNGDTGRRSGESERDFLIRTGQITAFGSANQFVMDDDDNDDDKEIGGDSANEYENVVPNGRRLSIKQEEEFESRAGAQMMDNINDNDDTEDANYSDVDDDYVPEKYETEEYDEGEELVSKSEGEVDTETKRAPGLGSDDGDELAYQKRLRKWIEHRSSNRKLDKFPSLPEWRKPHPDIPDAKLNNEFRIPGEIYSILFNYQKTCVQWLYELYQQQKGGIVGDEMGLGKTIQIVAFLASLHHSGLLNGPILIVCPATVMRQWCSEIHQWWPAFRAVILHSIGSGMSDKAKITDEEMEEMLIKSNPDDISYEDFTNSSKTKSKFESGMHLQKLIDKVVGDGHIIITTYVGLRIHSDKLLKVNWAYTVLDEGHKIRNPDADISLTCKKLLCYNRIILSGTPIQNNLIELWSLFDFIFPGRLGTLPVFQQQFVQPINMGGYANATNTQVQTGYRCAVALRDLISPYLLRRVKSDVAKDLPKKKEMVLFCKLTQFQRSKYLEFLHSDELSQIKGGKRHVLYGIDILRKICNHPDLLDRDYKKDTASYGDPKRSGKMQVVKQLLKLWRSEGHKTLLFTQSRQMLDILEEFIKFKDPEMSNLRYLRMDGTTNISNRQNLVDQFNNGQYDVFLLTTRVGGLGVNLTGANRIIIFDPDWNPSTDLQARERAWRIGQKREVSIYRLMISGTIEEKIYHRQIFKQFLMNKVLTDPKQKRFFKTNELQDLFSLGGEEGYSIEALNEEVDKHTKSLKDSKSKESDDLDQVVKLEGVSKLESFYNGKETEDENKQDDERLIEGLLGQKSLDNIVTHEQMMKSHTNGSSKMIQQEASRVAAKALDALKKSRKITKRYDIGTPTWTGKFGTAGKVVKKKPLRGNMRPNADSASILANIRVANKQIKNLPSEEDVIGKETTRKKDQLLAIQNYLKSQPQNSGTSKDIIENIGANLRDQEDIIQIRALMKTIAKFDKTDKVWTLKEEFVNDDY